MPAFSHFWIRRRPVADPMLQEADHPFLADFVEERSDIGVQYIAHLLAVDPNAERIHRVVRAAPRPESIREPEEIFLGDRVQQRGHRPLDNLVLKGRNRDRTLPSIGLGDVDPPARQCPVRSPLDPVVQILEIALEICRVVRPRQPIHTRRGVRFELIERLFEQVGADVVEERGEPLLFPFRCHFAYAFQRL